MRHPFADGWKILLSLFAGPIGFFLFVLVVVFSLGRCSKADATISVLRDTVRLTDSIEVVKWDTVLVAAKAKKAAKQSSDSAKRQSDSLDALVAIRDDSTAIVADTVVVVPPLLLVDLSALRLTVAKQDTTIRRAQDEIAALYSHDTTQQWRIATRDKLYARELKQANGPRWGYGVTVGYGCTLRDCGPSLNVGVTYSGKFPRFLQLLK